MQAVWCKIVVLVEQLEVTMKQRGRQTVWCDIFIVVVRGHNDTVFCNIVVLVVRGHVTMIQTAWCKRVILAHRSQ